MCEWMEVVAVVWTSELSFMEVVCFLDGAIYAAVTFPVLFVDVSEGNEVLPIVSNGDE